MRMDGEGERVVAVLWALTGMTFVWVILRNYTRGILLRTLSVDDHVYNVAFVLLMCYAIFLTISAHFGFGRDLKDIPKDGTLARAVFYQRIGQTFSLIDMALAKWSLGLFLLRLAHKTWHKAALWTMMLLLMGTSISVVVVFWLHCAPPAFLYDSNTPRGYCPVSFMPASYLFTGLCVAADFFFAFFPWLFIWKSNFKPREKALILSSLSLGVFAGVCGIKRTALIYTLRSPDSPKDTVPLMIWAGVEIAVTLMCIGIAVCLPLYKRIYTKFYNLRSIKRGSVSSPETPSMAKTGRISLRHPSLPRRAFVGHSGNALPVRWPGALSSVARMNKYRHHRKSSAPTCPERPPPTVGVWGLRGFDEPFATSLTTSIVGGRRVLGRSEDVPASLSSAMVREVEGITHEEALAGVVVTKEFEISRR